VYSLTSYGPFVVRMDRSNAPCGVDNFVHLTKSRFYDWTPYFRLTNSARLGVLQCDDIYRQEEGGGYKFPDEVTGPETYPRGTVAMGNQRPGRPTAVSWSWCTRGANIPPNYTVLGQAIYGKAKGAPIK